MRKRNLYMEQAEAPLHENATNPHRWACNDEILYCLQSIENHAPWVGQIWIVVDEETPDLQALSAKLRAKVKFVFHRGLAQHQMLGGAHLEVGGTGNG